MQNYKEDVSYKKLQEQKRVVDRVYNKLITKYDDIKEVYSDNIRFVEEEVQIASNLQKEIEYAFTAIHSSMLAIETLYNIDLFFETTLFEDILRAIAESIDRFYNRYDISTEENLLETIENKATDNMKKFKKIINVANRPVMKINDNEED